MATPEAIAGVKFVGNFLVLFGAAALAVMVAVGYFCLLMMLIIALSAAGSHSDIHGYGHGHGHGHGYHHNHSGLFDLFLLTWIFSNPGPRYGWTTGDEIASLMLLGIFFTAIAIGLAMSYGFPMIAVGLALGWGGAVAVIALGALIRAVGDSLPEDQPEVHPVDGQRPPPQCDTATIVI